MLIVRKSLITADIKDIRLGDSITVFPTKGRAFVATAHDVTDTDVLFLADESITSKPMNSEWTNLGGFEASNLNYWLQNEFLESLPKDIRCRIIELSIPTSGMIFGHDNLHKRFEPDNDDTLLLMSVITNRISVLGNELNGYWLANPTKRTISSSGFATVSYDGKLNHAPASYVLGVRPYFRIKK